MMNAEWRAEQANLEELYDQMADVAERREVMTGTSAPWYWRDPRYDHWAVGLVACAGDNGRIHYSRAGKQIMAACGGGNARRQPKNVRLLEGPKIVDCRLCAAIARQDRDLIDQRHVQNVILSHDRTNFIRREQQRKLHG